MAPSSFFTIEEAARILRIGRTAAYQAAKRYRASNGVEGLPVVAVGGSLRVPRSALEKLAGGPVSLDDPAAPVLSLDARRPASSDVATPDARRSGSRARVASGDDTQGSFPFTG